MENRGPFQADYRALKELERGLKPLQQVLRRQTRTLGQRGPAELLSEFEELLTRVDDTHYEVRRSTPADYWLPNPWIRERALGRRLLDIAGDRELLDMLGRQWREGTGQGPLVRDAVNSGHGYSRLIASETRLLVELGLPFNEASRIARRAWSANVAKSSHGADPYWLMMSRSDSVMALGASIFSLQWFSTSLAVRVQVLLADDPDEPTWISRVRQIMASARARSALAVVQSADTYVEPVGDPLSVFLACVAIALESADGNLVEASNLGASIVAGFIGVTIPDEPV